MVQVGLAAPAPFARLPPALPTSPALAELVRQAVAAAKAPPGPLLGALALAALWRYAADAESRIPGASDTVPRARALIHDQLGAPGFDLAGLAGAVHVSPAHLVRRFRAELRTTPMAYLWERRVAVAIDLLRSTGLPIKDVAARTGFRSGYHFSRRVKAQAGVPPTEVRGVTNRAARR